MREITVHQGIGDSEALVIKDNALINGSYNLSTEEQRVILACVEKAQRLHKTKKVTSSTVEVSLSASEYGELYDVSQRASYKALKEGVERLWERSVKIDINDGEGKQEYRWIQEKAIYKSGKCTLKFSDIVSQHISFIVTKAYAFRLRQIALLKNRHATRLFQLFQSRVDQDSGEGIWIVSLDDLRELLELGPSYNAWGDFKKRVILEPLKQINLHTSLKVEWEVHSKNGKAYESLRFTMLESDQLSLDI